MSIQKDLKKEGIEVTKEIDTLISDIVLKNISKRIIETFPDYGFTEQELSEKLSHLKLYKAKMTEGMAEANYFYKNSSIYFNEDIEYEDLEEFAIHECIHYLQEVKDDDGNLLKMGLSTFKSNRFIGLALNEAAVQTAASYIIGIEPDFEKYYNINLYTTSPSYYPVECSLLNEISYFLGEDILFKSTLFSNDDFKEKIVEMSSLDIYVKIQKLFDKILLHEEKIIKLNNKIDLLEEENPKIDRLLKKIDKLKNKIFANYFDAQNTIIQNFFDYEFEEISNLEDLESFRRKLYKFTDIMGSASGYKFFDNYYIEMMNKLEHKCNVLENGGTETALSIKHVNVFMKFLKKFFHIKDNYSETEKDI